MISHLTFTNLLTHHYLWCKLPIMPKEIEKYLTVEEVAKILGKDGATIRRYCRKGLFSGAKRAGLARTSAWRIPSSSVDAARQEMVVAE